MTIGILTNAKKDDGLNVTAALIKAIADNKLNYILESGIAALLNDPNGCDLSNFAKHAQIFIVIGGDGSILKAAKLAAENNIALLGINKGRLGFLAESEVSEIEQVVSRIKAKQYSIEKRSLINIAVGGKNYVALNEVVLQRSQESRILNFDVIVGTSYVDKYMADGFILSTPTGSTAYSLSAGGPILSPNIEGFVLTSICSHSLRNRPIVVSDSDEITVKFNPSANRVCVCVDGEIVNILDCAKGQTFLLKKADICASFIRFKQNDFYERLLSKLNIWSKEN